MRLAALIFQRNYGFAIAAKRSYFLQVSVRGRDSHHRAIAIDGVAGGGEIPASAFGVLCQIREGWRCGRVGLATDRLNNKARVRAFISLCPNWGHDYC